MLGVDALLVSAGMVDVVSLCDGADPARVSNPMGEQECVVYVAPPVPIAVCVALESVTPEEHNEIHGPGPGPALMDLDEDEMLRLYRGGLGHRKVAAQMGIHPDTVRRRLKLLGEPAHPSSSLLRSAELTPEKSLDGLGSSAKRSRLA